MLGPSQNHRAQVLWVGLCGSLAGLLLVGGTSLLGVNWSLMLLGGLLISALVFYSPAIGFLLTVAVIPMERIGRLTDDASMHTISLMRVLGLLVLGSFLLHAFLQKRRMRFGAAFVLYGLYSGFAFLTIAYTSDPLGTVRAAGAIAGNLLFFFLAVNVVRNWSLVKSATVVWLAASVLIGCYTIYDWYWGQSVEVEQIGVTTARFRTVMQDTSEWERLDLVKRAVGPTSSAAVYGINMILTIPFFLFFLRQRLPWPARAAALVSVFIVVYNIFLTNTRAAILLLVGVLALCLMRRLLILTPAQVVALALLVTAALAMAPGALQQRVLDPTRYRYAESGTFQIRANFWQAGVQIARENWFAGIGVGNQNTIPRYLKGDGPEATTVHNEFLMTLIEVGVAGWLIFFSFVGLMLWCTFKAAAVFRRSADFHEQYWFLVACQTAMIAVLVYGLQVDVFHFPLKGWWLIAGLSWVMYQYARQVAGGTREKLAEAQIA